MIRQIESRGCRPKRTGKGWECTNWITQEGEWFCGHCALPLPPVEVALDPTAGALDGEGGAREVALVFDRRDQSDYDELAEFVVSAGSSDKLSRRREIPIALDLEAEGTEGARRPWTELGPSLAAWGRHILPLKGGSGPVDVDIALRHRRRRGGEAPLLIGHYDYPLPEVSLRGPGRIMLHRDSDALRIAAAIEPESSLPISSTLEIPAAQLSLPGSCGREGGALLFFFSLDPAAIQGLSGISDSTPAILRLAFKGVAGDFEEPLVLTRAATLEILTREELRGLSGRRARVGVQLRNDGGSAAIVEGVGWRLLDRRGERVAGGALEAHRGTRVPSAGTVIELRPVLVGDSGEPIPRGSYTLALEVDYRDEDGEPSIRSSAGAELILDVREEAPYRGLVCIDFGTTDTAAAILPSGENFFQSPVHGAVPRPIELGAISPMDKSLGRLFVPTQVAVGEDEAGAPAVLFADEAVERFRTLDRGRLVDRLKWKLGRGEADEDLAEYGSIEELVGLYLDHVRRLIEEHPDVAARVETVIATRPARFGELRERALIRAFARAGMTVDETRFGVSSRPMVSESWPPVLLMLPIRQDPGGAGGTRLLSELRVVEPKLDFPEPIDIAALEETDHFICIFDIGGGSTDVSLLRLSWQGGRIHVADQWTHTDDEFAGEGIRNIIVDELRTSARLALAGSGKRFPEDIHMLRGIAGRLQFYPNGPFNYASSFFFDFIEKLTALAPADSERLWRRMAEGASMLPAGGESDPGSDKAEALLVWLRDQLGEYVQPSFGYVQKAVLPLGGGNSLTLAGDALHDLMIRVFFRFFKKFEPRIAGIYAELRYHLDGAGTDRLRMLMTGRGSAFALNELLLGHVAAGQGVTSPFHRAPPVCAKAVTSWGALGLYAARLVARRLEFVGLVGGYALCAQDFLTGKRVGAVLLDEVRIGDATFHGVALHRIPSDFDHCILTVSEDLGPRQEADVYARLEQSGIDLSAERSRSPAGGILFQPETRKVFLVSDFNRPVVE